LQKGVFAQKDTIYAIIIIYCNRKKEFCQGGIAKQLQNVDKFFEKNCILWDRAPKKEKEGGFSPLLS
jgi:hypothetical protein